MKPFKPKKYKRRLITYKRLLVAVIVMFASYVWYSNCDEVSVNNKQTMEVK